MTPEAIALRLLEMALAVAPAIVEVITDRDRVDIDARIERARVAVLDPIDTTADDAARRAELERVIGGEA